MQVLRLNEVLTRVVAWHNRHPLARRIQASQVHSIGEVLLPFASAQPLSGAPPATAAAQPPKTGESLADVVSARAAARPAAAQAAAAGPAAPEAAEPPGLEVHAVPADAPDALAAATDLDPFSPEPGNDTAGNGDAAAANPEIDTAAGAASDPQADLVAELAAAAAAADDTADPDGQDATAALPAASPLPGDRSLGIDPADSQDEAPGFSATTADEVVYAPGPPPEATAAAAAAAVEPTPTPTQDTLQRPQADAAPLAPAWPAATPVGRFRRLWARLTGRRPDWPRLESAFSRDFIWPLSPRAVARWAQRHGQLHALAPADWPRRQVDADPARLGPLRQAGLAHTVQLHVLTAAIGVGDRRIRVLMSSDGHIIGPRAYSRPRSAGAAGLLVAALLGGAWQWGGLHSAADADSVTLAAQAAQAASAASAASAVALAASAASAAMAETTADLHQAALAASASATAAVGAASAAEPTAAPATVAAAAPATDPAHGTPVHGTPADSTPAPAEPAQPPAPHADAQPATTASLPAAERTAAGPLGRIRPSLSDEERQLARQQSARLRGDVVAPATAQAVTPPAIVYAVVTRPNRQREVAASGLAVMRSAGARLSPPVPEHRELMQQQGEWRAAWWPFANQVDAERARVMLASRGLKAEVVEF